VPQRGFSILLPFFATLEILLHFLDYCIGWLAGIRGRKNTELMPKLENDVLQSSNNFLDFVSKNWDMSAILVVAVASFIIIDRE
jgi:hypothetical protein